MDRTKEKIERLEVLIARQEGEIARLEGEIAEIRGDLQPFEERYERLVRGVADRVAVARDAVKEFEAMIRKAKRGAEVSFESLWKETSGKKAGDEPRNHAHTYEDFILKSTKRAKVDETLKQMYRRLARRYHPDLAADEADREHRNQLMVLINQAYADGDIQALFAIESAAKDEKTNEEDLEDAAPINVLRLRQLQQISVDLSMKLADLKLERVELMHSPLMEMKFQDSIGRVYGQDLLQEIADDLENEYWMLMKQLDTLRSSVQI